jgi:hypothetical protein
MVRGQTYISESDNEPLSEDELSLINELIYSSFKDKNVEPTDITEDMYNDILNKIFNRLETDKKFLSDFINEVILQENEVILQENVNKLYEQLKTQYRNEFTTMYEEYKEYMGSKGMPFEVDSFEQMIKGVISHYNYGKAERMFIRIRDRKGGTKRKYRIRSKKVNMYRKNGQRKSRRHKKTRKH